jgi:hypothetical protein
MNFEALAYGVVIGILSVIILGSFLKMMNKK